MEVQIDNRQSRLPIPRERVQAAAEAILSALGSRDAELSISIVDDAEIAGLNREYLRREGPTNVIAFPMGDDPMPDGAPRMLGDVVVSADTAEREASDAGTGFERRFLELLIHGILHLFGYDHVDDPAEAERMAEKEAELIRLVDG